MRKARVARPNGHQKMKDTIMSAIHAPMPNSSSFAVIAIRRLRRLTV
jgi:hypothetical protein